MTIQWWKLGREAERIKQQIRFIPQAISDPIKRRRHDAQRDALLRQTEGVVPAQRKIAIFLLFQPNGLSASTFWTCEHLLSQGYAPLIISNAPLTLADTERLKACAWLIVERPNFGYDFGGYRDGIWLLQQATIKPEHLLIINDSIWFPLRENDTMIAEMEAKSADFIGALSLEPKRLPYDTPNIFQSFFGSYFLMIKKDAFTHPAFDKFWSSYQMTSNKHKTVRRGERGFSHAMFSAGISSDCIYSRRQIDRDLIQFEAPALRAVLPDLVTLDVDLERSIAEALCDYSNSEPWRKNAIDLATRATEKQNVLMTAPILSLNRYQVPYIKKQKVPANIKALGVIIQRLQSGVIPPVHSTIEPELRQLAASKPNRY